MDMSTLPDHIKSHPEKSMSDWASSFGISRPHLYALLDGSRNPSIEVAKRIAQATSGDVPISAWSNFKAIIEAEGRA
jgi:transcriptional regulator with XRE-family HTH domain